MEIIISFILAFITFWFGGGQAQLDSTQNSAVIETATVVRVIDGDTITVTIDDQEETVPSHTAMANQLATAKRQPAEIQN